MPVARTAGGVVPAPTVCEETFVKRILVTGGLSWDSILHLGELPDPWPQTVFSRSFHESIGSTGAGKAMNLGRLGLDVTLHPLIGGDPPGDLIRARWELAHADLTPERADALWRRAFSRD